MESVVATRGLFMETLPAQVITVEKAERVSRFETIVEESLSLDEECAASLVTFGEVAPAPVITVKRPSFRSSLDTICEDTMQSVAEYFVVEAADAILRSSPALRLEYLETLSSQFCIDSQGAGRAHLQELRTLTDRNMYHNFLGRLS